MFMEKLYEIVHGSKNSLDRDVYWVTGKLPTKEELTHLNKSQDISDVNFITIDDGKVTGCIKGVIDEINNGIIDTFDLHEQELDSCPISKRMNRDSFMKGVRAVRGILLQFSKTIYRPEVKEASRSHSISKKISQAKKMVTLIPEIDDFVRMNKTNVFKFFAFQIAQSHGLLKDIEIYTKNDAKKYFPELALFIDREEFSISDVETLINSMLEFLDDFQSFVENNYLEKSQFVIEKESGMIFDIKYEKYVDKIEENNSKNKKSKPKIG